MHRWKVFLLFIISLVITVLSTLIPLFNGYFVDSLITADNYRPVFTIGAALILIGVLNVLFSFYENLARQEAMASYVRIREVLSLPQESPGRIPINKILNVEIDSLSFSYSGCKPLFNKFSFKFETNNVYLLTGDNGTGKSTLVDIIIGLRDDYSSGRILYNGIDIKEIDAFSLRKNNISIMLQSSIDEGIAVGEYFDEASVTSDQVSNFIKDNNLFSFYHFFCTDDIWSQGMKAFSRGEIQKIRLLRSLTKETANFLILDEPSSFMDFESSNELMSVLQSVRNDRIILLISHDPIYSESDFIKISI